MARPISEHGDTHAKNVVLVADDDPLIVATLAQRLRSAGYAVLEAFDGPTALAAAVDAHPDLAIIDHSMPGMNGLELARILAASSTTAVIFLSAHNDEALVNDAIAAGAMTYVVKPIDTEQLLPIVRTALQRAREAHALQGQNDKLRATLERDQSVSAAAGVLMATFRLDQREALERLRYRARSRRAKLEDVATELLRTFDAAGKLLHEYSAPKHPAGPAKAAGPQDST